MNALRIQERKNLVILSCFSKAVNIPCGQLQLKSGWNRNCNRFPYIPELVITMRETSGLGKEPLLHCWLWTNQGIRILASACPQRGILAGSFPLSEIYTSLMFFIFSGGPSTKVGGL